MRGRALSHEKRIEPLVRRLAPAELRSLRSKAGRGKVSGAASCLAARRRCGPGFIRRLEAENLRRQTAAYPGRLPRPQPRVRRVRRGSSPPRRPDRDRDAAHRPRAAAILHARRPSGRRNAWLCNSRSAGTRADPQRATDDLLRFPLAAVAPTSCRTPSCTLTLVRSGQPSSEASLCVRVPSRWRRAVLGYFRRVGQAHGASEEPSRVRRVS